MGAGSIGLVFFIILVCVFFGGCGIFLVGGIGFGITTAKHKNKRIRILFAVVAAIGIIMILIPSLYLHLVRKDNAEDRKDCIETDYSTEYHYEKIDGQYRCCFEYNGKMYVEIKPESINEDGIETVIPNQLRTKGNALLNIHEHIDFMDRLFNDYEQATVFSMNSDYGEGFMVTETCVFCLEKDLKNAEKYYEDFLHYDYYINNDDDWDARKGTPVNLGNEMHQISKMDLGKTVNNPKGKEIEINYISKDDLFEGTLIFGVVRKSISGYVLKFA